MCSCLLVIARRVSPGASISIQPVSRSAPETFHRSCQPSPGWDLCHPETVRVAASHQAEAEKIAAELAAIARSGMVLPGSISERRTRCGRRNCGCHADPPRLHGPYWQWTRKIAARTICRWLSAGQHGDYTPWIDNDRRLRELLARLEALGTAAFEADPRWKR